MFGQDVERILLVLNKIKDEAANQIQSLTSISSYRLDDERHRHIRDGENRYTDWEISREEPQPDNAFTYSQPIVELGNNLDEDIQKMNQIEDKMYNDINKFNNEYGSPWKELRLLKEKINNMDAYANAHPDIKWLAEKHCLMHLIQIVLSFASDAKYANLIFQDWTQRAYDNQFNDNKPSISWDNFNNPNGTIGNRGNQFVADYNVHIRDEDNSPW